MTKLLKARIRMDFIVNPFYIYVLSFGIAIFAYFWGWCDLYPALSPRLIIFFIISFIIFLLAGYTFHKKKHSLIIELKFTFLNDLIFGLVLLLGLFNILVMGYIPILDRSRDYREFGIPVIDPLFNSLSIFFSVFLFHNFLHSKKKRFLIYFLIILIFQVLIFRRSTIVWILASSIFLLIFSFKSVRITTILIGLLCVPLLSFGFGLYGNYRSNLSKSFIIEDLKASDLFKKTGINHNHYVSYIYLTSPIANLQKNIDEGEGFLNKADGSSFILYSLLPESFTLRIDKMFSSTPPTCNLIHPQLIVGSFLMVSFCTIGWAGMIIMLLILFIFISLGLFLSERSGPFRITSLCIITTTVSLLVFANFLNRLDVIMMVFVYPLFFHYLYSRDRIFRSPALQ